MLVFFAFASVGFVRKEAVSLLTELENVGGWFSTKVTPLRGFLFGRDPRRQRRIRRNLWSAPKINRAFIFFSKKQIKHVFQPTFSKVG
ncbi:MAG: hypothetical protein D6714_00395 [Bacteroidetes bacterium]|nr:MAG: hypothetical protein D6714_00395 [Bacteroidota bacterium]